jgi:glutaredoxin
MSRIWQHIRSFFRPISHRHVEVILYTRGDCPLCDKAKAFLESERARLGFQLREHDIATNGEWAARYVNRIPVIVVDGKERFRGAIDPILWRRLMTAVAHSG